MYHASEIYGSEGKTEAKSWGHKLINPLNASEGKTEAKSWGTPIA